MRVISIRVLNTARPFRHRIETRFGLCAGQVLLLSVVGLVCGGHSVSGSSQEVPAERDRIVNVARLTSSGSGLMGVQAGPADSTNVMRSFLGRGVIREIGVGKQTLIIRHEAIPGFMPKMTMEFAVRDMDELRGLRAGNPVTFRVRANEAESWIEEIKLAGTNEPPPSPVQPVTALAQIAKLKPGDLLPDAELVGEDGRQVRFSKFEGQAVAFTFIFTRCPLPDFCPRMSHHFNRARELLLQIPGGPRNWQFLSISFDPEFDTPGVLARYAENFRGQNPDRWLFAAAPTNVLAAMTCQLDFRFANDEGSLVHNLRTVVVDPMRRIYRQFNGNQWKPEELAQALAKATRSTQ